MGEPQNTLNKQDRLKSRKAINALFEDGSSIKGFPLLLKYKASKNNSISLKAAFVVPKRQIKLAVNRNRIKRRLKEAYRVQNKPLKKALQEFNLSLDLILIYRSPDILDFKEIEEKIILILQRLVTELNPQKTYEEKV